MRITEYIFLKFRIKISNNFSNIHWVSFVLLFYLFILPGMLGFKVAFILSSQHLSKFNNFAGKTLIKNWTCLLRKNGCSSSNKMHAGAFYRSGGWQKKPHPLPSLLFDQSPSPRVLSPKTSKILPNFSLNFDYFLAQNCIRKLYFTPKFALILL